MDPRSGGFDCFEIELRREILIFLARLERSPPEPTFIELETLEAATQAAPSEIVVVLQYLREVFMIDGAGLYQGDKFIFRGLTRKGKQVLAALNDEDNWKAAKRHYGWS